MQLKNINGNVSITIDNESIPLQMKEIIKEDTFFTIQESLNTPLYSDINVNILLERTNKVNTDIETDTIDDVEYVNEDDITEIPSVVENGSVSLVICDATNPKITYISKTINFYDGIIQEQIPNTLSIGTYLFQIYYPGNKYYKESSLTVYFTIEKREIQYVLDNEYVEGYPNESVSVGATFKDVLTNIPISNCKINYTFNNVEYITQTDNKGYVVFNVVIPSVDPNRCIETIKEESDDVVIINEDDEFYVDQDGNLQYVTNIYNWDNEDSDVEGEESTFINDDTTTEDSIVEIEIVHDVYDDTDRDEEDTSSNINIAYPINISIDDDVYYSANDFVIYVYNKIIDTEIHFSAIANNSGIIHIEGDVVSNQDDNIVEYGEIVPKISNTTITEVYKVDSFGHFSIDIDMPSPILSTKEPATLSDYSVQIPTKTTLISNTESTITRSWADKHYVDFTATVKAGYTPITWSMVTFLILKGEKELYRYVTELNRDGEAFFSYNISTLGEFNVKAIYHGMFGYLTSSSETLTYTVTEQTTGGT